MQNWKTTLLGIIALAAFIIKSLFGIEVTADVQAAFVTVIIFLIALFAKDASNADDDES